MLIEKGFHSMGENKDKKTNMVYLGLDLGTNSVGWAVTDGNFKLLRKRNQHLWGIRLFDEAKTANDRRMFRTQRKRLERRRARIFELRQLFVDEIQKVDPNFFHRLDYSFSFDWKDEANRVRVKKSILFDDPDYKDRDFFKKYPTIFHLRKALMEWTGPEKPDIRLVYLAIHHIIKYRGNFLDPSDNLGNNVNADEIKDLFNQIDASYVNLSQAGLLFSEKTEENIVPCGFEISYEQAEKIKEEILPKIEGSMNTKEALLGIFDTRTLTNMEGKILVLISGGKTKFSDLFPGSIEDVEQLGSFSLDDWDEKIEPKLDSYPEDVSNILTCCKRFNDALKLTRILGDNSTISDAMVERYEKHHQQLRELKRFVKTYYPQKYNAIFREASDGKGSPANYSHYVGSTLVQGRKGRDFANNTAGKGGHVKRDEFYDFLKKTLDMDKKENLDKASPTSDFERKEIEEKKKILAQIEANDYLLRQNSGENGIIKRQLHQKELEAILERMEQYYPFLKAKDADGLSVSEKILSIFKFKIPYYIGPLDNNANNPNSWAKKTDAWKDRKPGDIHPWNWQKFVNEDQAAEEFIQRMVNKCSYILSANTLPRFSILYSEYCVLNEINKIVIKSGNSLCYLDQATKDDVLNLYKTKGKVSKSDISEVVKKHLGRSDFKLYTAGSTSDDDKLLTNDYLQANMRSYVDLENILGSAFDVEKAEQIIKAITLFEDKNILLKQVMKIMPSLSRGQVEKILKLRYKGWGSLSAQLLTELKAGVVNDDGVIFYTGPSIIELMRRVTKKDGADYSENFMQILYNEDYHFLDQIKEINEKTSDKYTNYVDYTLNLHGSPMTKRAIIQAMKIVREVEHIIGRPVDAIFMESPRSQDPSIPKAQKVNGNDLNRKKVLENQYKYAQRVAIEKYSNFATRISEFQEKLGKANISLKAKRYFLYFNQLGYDVYTGKPIDFDDLDKENLYDIDHIIPRSVKKDDSLDNLVLVSQSVNRDKKKDIYPIPTNIIQDNPDARKVIEFLHQSKLISDSKYDRLMRPVTRPLTDEEKATFINRQIVSTSQSIKLLWDVLHTDYFNRIRKQHPDWKKEAIEDAIPELNMPRASLAHEFRDKFDIPKCRETNDFHHAHDAYINIITGECSKSFYHLAWKIDKVTKAWVSNDQKNKDRILENNPDRKVTTRLVDKIFNGNIPCRFSTSRFDWIPGEMAHSTIQIVKRQLQNTDVLYTKMLVQGDGAMYDQNVLSPKKAKGKDLDIRSAIKSKTGKDSRFRLMGDVSKYGYFDNAKVRFYSLVKYIDKKEKEVFALISVRTDSANKYLNDKDIAEKYASIQTNSNNVQILIKKLLVNTLLTIGPESLPIRITGKTRNSLAYQLSYQPFYSQAEQKYCNRLLSINNSIQNERKLKEDKQSLSLTDRINNLISSKNENIKDESLVINSDNNLKLYDRIIGRFLSKRFKDTYFSDNFRKNASANRDKFASLSIDNQVDILCKLLQLSQCKGLKVDLSKIGMVANVGGLTINSKLKGPLSIYTESPTGFYRHKIFELDDQGNGKVFLNDGSVSDSDD